MNTEQEHPLLQEEQDSMLSPVAALSGGFTVGMLGENIEQGNADVGAGHLSGRQGLHIGSLRLAIRYDEGSELIDLEHIYALPNAPAWFLGMCNFHGAPVPVIDLHSLWLGVPTIGTQSGGEQTRRLLVLSRDEDATAIVIDALPERLMWQGGQALSPDIAPDFLQGVLRQVWRIGEQIWFDIEVSQLLDACEARLSKT